MPRTWHQPKELRTREYKVEDLGHEEEEQSLGEMCLDSNYCKRHTSDIAEGVTRERACGIPIMVHQTKSDRYER